MIIKIIIKESCMSKPIIYSHKMRNAWLSYRVKRTFRIQNIYIIS